MLCVFQFFFPSNGQKRNVPRAMPNQVEARLSQLPFRLLGRSASSSGSMTSLPLKTSRASSNSILSNNSFTVGMNSTDSSSAAQNAIFQHLFLANQRKQEAAAASHALSGASGPGSSSVNTNALLSLLQANQEQAGMQTSQPSIPASSLLASHFAQQDGGNFLLGDQQLTADTMALFNILQLQEQQRKRAAALVDSLRVLGQTVPTPAPLSAPISLSRSTSSSGRASSSGSVDPAILALLSSSLGGSLR